jgi:hypothetical protein
MSNHVLHIQNKSNVIATIEQSPRTRNIYLFIILVNIANICSNSSAFPFYHMTSQWRKGLSKIDKTSFPYATKTPNCQ